MIKNYIKAAWRSLQGNLFFTVLNIIGLAFGICVATLLFAYVREELSFNSMYKQKDNIYRLHMTLAKEQNQMINVPNAVGPALKDEVTGVEQMVRMVKIDFGAIASIRANEDNFLEKKLYLADSSLFTMFDFNFIAGNAQTAFANKKSIILSESSKKKLFGDADAIGQRIYINQRDTVEVSAVFQDLPNNSTVDCNMVINIMDSWMGQDVYWSNASYETYVRLATNAKPFLIAQQATALIDKYVDKDNRYFSAFSLQPLAEVHLHSTHLIHGVTTQNGSITVVRALTTLALLVLLIACINYMNLATAKSQKNAKEVGINKVLGASTLQITSRYYIETAIITFLAIVLGLLMAFLLMPFFNYICQTTISYSQLLNWEMAGITIILFLSITFIAGSYPAFFLSGIKSIHLMNKGFNKKGKSFVFRQSLVVFQFSISTLLIISIIVMLTQIDYVNKKDLGYQPEQVVSIPIRALRSLEKIETFKSQLMNLQGTKSLTYAQTNPGDIESGKNTYKNSSDKIGISTSTCVTFGATVETLGLTLLAGTELPDILGKQDTNCYALINEVILNYLGFKTADEAIGKTIFTEMGPTQITGVVKDFNYKNLKAPIGAYMYYTMNNAPEAARNLLIRYKTQNTQQYIQQIQARYAGLLPEAAFDFTFLDSYVKNQYDNELKTSRILSLFSLLTVFIACLGLLGLAAYTAESRSKEISLRKILGANLWSIWNLLTLNYIKMLLLAFVIAAPIAYFLMNKWLADFAYRIEVPWWAALVAILIVSVFTLITISFQTLKAAQANPVKSLRNE